MVIRTMIRSIRHSALAALLMMPAVATAQSGGGDGYLFRRPFGSFSLRAGGTRPTASGGVFDFASSLLTLGPDRYAGFTGALEGAFNLSQRTELVVGVSINRRQVGSEYRDWTDNNDRPIEQTTSLNRTPLSLGLRWNLIPAGRSVSRLAWVPSRLVPYVAAGGGAMAWRFQQTGDFIDFQTASKDVFHSVLQDHGWAPMAYAATGLSWAVHPSVALTGEVRYDLARAPLRGDFEGFDNINLSGLGVTAGLQFRY